MSNDEVKNKAVVVENTTVKANTVTVQKTVIYIGETLPNLQKYTIFNNGIPQFVAAEIEKCSAIGELIVPISDYSAVKEQLTKKGTRYHTLNFTIQQYLKGVKVNGV